MGLHGDPFARSLVDSGVLRCCDVGLQHRRRRIVVARLCVAATGAGIWLGGTGCAWYCVVSVPPIHAAYALGYGPDGDYRSRAFFRSTTHEKHVARHRWPQFRELAVLLKLSQRCHVSLMRTELRWRARIARKRLSP